MSEEINERLKMIVDLTQLEENETGIIKNILGGHGIITRLQNLGIRPGKAITKVSSHFMRGPQVISIDNTFIAIGFGIAKKVIVEVEK